MWVPIQFGYFIYFILFLFVFCFHCFDFISYTVKDENKIEKNDNWEQLRNKVCGIAIGAIYVQCWESMVKGSLLICYDSFSSGGF